MADTAAAIQFCADLLKGARPSSSPPWWWAAAIAPVVTALFTILGAWIAISFDRRKAVNQELIKKRIEVFDDMAPKLNEILCFIMCLGDWRALTPPVVLQRKRELDRIFHVYRPLFSDAFVARYDALMARTFKTFGGPGSPARLRVERGRIQSQWGNAWRPRAWNASFVDEQDDMRERDDIWKDHEALIGQFAVEIGAPRPTPRKRPGPPAAAPATHASHAGS